MEVYEHTSNPPKIRRVVQTITDIMHSRPNFEFRASYFSRYYTLATKSLYLHAETLLPVVKDSITRHREWYKRYFGRPDATGAREMDEDADGDELQDLMPDVGLRKVIDSPVAAGLPPSDDPEKQTVTMHHAGVILNITEFIPALDLAMDVYDAAQTVCREMETVIHGLLSERKMNAGSPSGSGSNASGAHPGKNQFIPAADTINRAAVSCAVWKAVNFAWRILHDHSFKTLVPRGKRVIGHLDAELWLENPLLADLLLVQHYSPLDLGRSTSATGPMHLQVTAQTGFTDNEFRPRGLEILLRVLKVVIYRDRLFFSWLETEQLRKVYESQFPLMSVNKAAYSGRLNSLRFDSPDVADNTAVEEDYEEGYIDEGEGHGGGGAESDRGEDDRPDINSQYNIPLLRYGPLAIAELDDTIFAATTASTARGAFDLATLEGVQLAMKPEGLRQLRTSLKVQTTEKFWHLGAVEIHDMLLGEVYIKLLSDGEVVKPEKNAKPLARRQDRLTTGTDAQQAYDVDYRLLVTSLVPKKRTLRKLLQSEYGKEMKNQAKSDLSEEAREVISNRIKISLIEWYFSNMVELSLEECERAEYAKSVSEFRVTTMNTPYGRLLYRPSKITRHFHFFANQEKGMAETESDPMKLNMEAVQTQEVVHTDGSTADKICKLWYLPYITEIVMMSNSSEKSLRGATDLSQKVFRNSQVFRRAMVIQSIMADLFDFVRVFSHLLQDNHRFAVQIRQVREADYVVTGINNFKKDLMYQGPQADFNKVEHYLLSKWQLWILKLRMSLASSLYTVGMGLNPTALGILASQYRRTSGKSDNGEMTDTPQLFTVGRTYTFGQRTPHPSPYVFSALEERTKRSCDKKVLDLEECLDEFMQATLLNFGENAEEINRMQNDFLLTGLKLLNLRRNFLRISVPDGVIKTEAQLGDFFRTYKMRILVPAIRLYHKIGAKGNASIPLLLRDDMVIATVDFDFNRIAQASFDKCQATLLQTELLREYTFQILKHARHYHDRLADERTGRLFKVYENIDVSSNSGDRTLAFRLAEEDYATKTSMINEFTKDLWKAHGVLLREAQEAQKIPGRKPAPGQMAPPSPFAQLIDEPRVFICTRDALTQAIIKFTMNLTKWQEKRRGEQDHFMGTLFGRLVDMVRNNERLIRYLAQEKRELIENYKRDVRLLAFHLCSELHADFASSSVELAELRKQRRIDERKIRNRILNEYDDLVHELVQEINVLRNRFSEYRVNTFQEVMNIMGEAKKEELQVVVDNKEMPAGMQESARMMIKHEEDVQEIQEENQEMKMTLLKLRSMNILKEQALRSLYEKKARKMREDNKVAEEKLWDSYREAEARERALRRQLTKAQKLLSVREAELEVSQRQLRDEQQRVRQLTPIKDRATSAGGRRNQDAESTRIAELQERLHRYEVLNIDALMQELNDKTRLLEQMIDDRKKGGGMVGRRISPERKRRAVSARLNRPPMIIKAVVPRRKGLGAYSDYKEGVIVDEDNMASPGEKLEKDLNDHLVEKMNRLAMENKTLRNALADCGVIVREDLDLAETPAPIRRESIRKSVMWEDEQSIPEIEPSLTDVTHPRTAQSAPAGGRPGRPHRIYSADPSRPNSGDSGTRLPLTPSDITSSSLPNSETPRSPAPGSNQELRQESHPSPSPPSFPFAADSDTNRPSGTTRAYRTTPRFVEGSPPSVRRSQSLLNRGSSQVSTSSDVIVPSGKPRTRTQNAECTHPFDNSLAGGNPSATDSGKIIISFVLGTFWQYSWIPTQHGI
ncbi:hypothetical protein DFS34DRAFT_376408 [Phlyctochytrium arcticum]|nr:hypothetical protein DFS34DRAFT_376408 [Phlyctochytrium arcticum]